MCSDTIEHLDNLLTKAIISPILLPNTGADADRVHWLGEPSQIFKTTTHNCVLFQLLKFILKPLSFYHHNYDVRNVV